MVAEFPGGRRPVEFIASAEDDLAAMPQPVKNISASPFLGPSSATSMPMPSR
jgi:hypothetical protein